MADEHTPAPIAMLVARWGGWPGWMPLFVHTLGANRGLVDFHLLSDVPPHGPLPPNVFFHSWTIAQLLERLRRTVGCTLTDISTQGTSGNRKMSTAKVNDLKPTFGEAFQADLLRPYAWWGWMQEDVLVGDLASCITPHILRSHDLITPFQPPWHSSVTAIPERLWDPTMT